MAEILNQNEMFWEDKTIENHSVEKIPRHRGINAKSTTFQFAWENAASVGTIDGQIKIYVALHRNMPYVHIPDLDTEINSANGSAIQTINIKVNLIKLEIVANSINAGTINAINTYSG